MTEFLALIKEDNISVFGLIKKTLITIKDDFGTFAKAIFLYTLVFTASFLLYAAILSFALSDGEFKGLDSLMVLIVSIVCGVYSQAYGIKMIVETYYTILGYPPNANNRTMGDYAKKAVGLGAFLLVVFIAIYIIMAIVSFVLMLAFGVVAAVLGGDTGIKFIAAVTIILSVFTNFVYLIVSMIYMGGLLEYLVTDEGIFNCMGKAFSIGANYIWGYFKKGIAVVIALFGLAYLSGVILNKMVYIMVGGEAKLEAIAKGQETFSIGGPEMLPTALLFVLFVIVTIVTWVLYTLYSCGYYANLNYQEGNGILGLKKEKRKPNNVQKSQSLQEEIKTSETRQVTNQGQMDVIELNGSTEKEVQAVSQQQQAQLSEDLIEVIELDEAIPKEVKAVPRQQQAQQKEDLIEVIELDEAIPKEVQAVPKAQPAVSKAVQTQPAVSETQLAQQAKPTQQDLIEVIELDEAIPKEVQAVPRQQQAQTQAVPKTQLAQLKEEVKPKVIRTQEDLFEMLDLHDSK